MQSELCIMLLKSFRHNSCECKLRRERDKKRGKPLKNRIKELRKANKLSQGELADIVGTTRQTITSIEVGKYTASLGLAYKIAHYFNLTIEEVFDFSDLESEE